MSGTIWQETFRGIICMECRQIFYLSSTRNPEKEVGNPKFCCWCGKLNGSG